MTKTSGILWIITGTRGAGKTRFCQRVVIEAQKRGLTVKGVLSPAVFTGEVKTGIKVQDLATGDLHLLATLREEIPDAITPRWKFDETSLAWGSEVLNHSTPCDLLIVDELGPLELQHNSGWIEGITALDSGDYRAALVVIRTELVSLAQNRWPQAEVIQITQEETETTIKNNLGQILSHLN